MPTGRDKDGSNSNTDIFVLGDTTGLPFLDSTVRGTTRGDGEEEKAEEFAKVFSFALEPMLRASSLLLG